MKQEEVISRGPTPMLEIVITLGVFIGISVLILRIFYGANELQLRGVNTTQSMMYAETVAERLKGDSAYESVLEELGFVAVEEDGEKVYQQYFNQDWMRVDAPHAYILQVKIQSVEKQYGRLNTYIIEVMDADTIWCKFAVKRYL